MDGIGHGKEGHGVGDVAALIGRGHFSIVRHIHFL